MLCAIRGSCKACNAASWAPHILPESGVDKVLRHTLIRLNGQELTSANSSHYQQHVPSSFQPRRPAHGRAELVVGRFIHPLQQVAPAACENTPGPTPIELPAMVHARPVDGAHMRPDAALALAVPDPCVIQDAVLLLGPACRCLPISAIPSHGLCELSAGAGT